jgi:hypothetical protein
MVIYIFFTEFFAPENKGIVSTIEGILECLILGFFVLVLKFVSSNTTTLIAFAFLTASCSFIGLMWLDESPIWLLKSGNAKDAMKIMQRIYRVNGVKQLKKEEEPFLTTSGKIEESLGSMVLENSFEI